MNIRDFILTAPRSEAHALTCLLNQTHEHAGNGRNIMAALCGLRVEAPTVDALRRDAIDAWKERRIIDFARTEAASVG